MNIVKKTNNKNTITINAFADNKKKLSIQTTNIKKNKKFIKLYSQLTKRMDLIFKEMKVVKNDINILHTAYEYDIKKIEKEKRKKKTISGIEIAKKIPRDLAYFIEVDRESKFSRAELHSKICRSLKKRGLVNKKDGRIYKVNDEVIKLFGINKSANNVIDAKDKNGLTIYTLQKFISKKLNSQ
jgi:hypothetical protein